MKSRKKSVLMVAMATVLLYMFWRQPGNQNGYQREEMDFTEQKISKAEVHEPTVKILPLMTNSVVKVVPKRRVRVYIYKLPNRFNYDIHECVSPRNRSHWVTRCYDLLNDGYGRFLYQAGELGVYNTHMFSLEVILHHRLLRSKYVTDNPAEADVFYIPSYFGIMYFCRSSGDARAMVEDMFNFVKTMPYFQQGRPHLTSLGKIERELAWEMFPIVLNPNFRNVTYIIIEKDHSEMYREKLGLKHQQVIVAPYPSYVHLDLRQSKEQTINSTTLTSRSVFMFLAASDRQTNPFRVIILNQFHNNVSGLSFMDYMKIRNSFKNLESPFNVWLITQECVGQQENFTINWMQNSVFCLQPHGDSPTRKSFYDSIQSGCIPVIFKFPMERVEYPFQRVLNYSDFVVTIDAARVQTNKEQIVDILKNIPTSEVERLHKNVLRVARKLQYSVIDKEERGYDDLPYVDALDMIIQEASYIYGLNR